MDNSKSGSSNTTIIGFALLFILYIAYIYISQPSQEEVAKWQAAQTARQDSIARVDSIKQVQLKLQQAERDSFLRDTTLTQIQKDSILQVRKAQEGDQKFGVFSNAAQGSPKIISLKNEDLKLDISSQGGRIVNASILKDGEPYLAYDHRTKEDNNDKTPVQLLNHPRNKFEYHIPMRKLEKGYISTTELNFEVQEQSDSLVVFRAYTNDKQGYIEQKYLLKSNYIVDYDVTFEKIGKSAGPTVLQWQTFLGKIEKNDNYERTMSSIHYKEIEESPNYCTCATSAEEDLKNPIQWIAHSQQFFNTSLVGKSGTSFAAAKLNTFMTPGDSIHLKELTSIVRLPEDKSKLEMQWYIGPNDYNSLAAANVNLERIIPYGWSIFGWISRSVIRPLFNGFATFIPNYGIIILLLTLLIRLAMYPLQRKMLVSSVKMSILRPELTKMREKHKDDQQRMQMEQMKMFNQYGVSPLGGCLPMVLTMPIWIALYRFFPASIDFRQQSFLWADDLVSYDSIWDFGYVPFINTIYGDHISLFTLLWAISMFAYLFYNSKQMDMAAAGGNAKMMKYLQYAFPVIFFFALNNWASGLTAYMLFSNLINIAQTFITKNYLINKDKLKAQMEEIKNNPKKRNSMMDKYQKMLEDQQKMQASAKKKKGKR